MKNIKSEAALWVGITLAFVGFMLPMGYSRVGNYIFQTSFSSGYLFVVLIIIAVVSAKAQMEQLHYISLIVASLCLIYPLYHILQNPLYGRNIRGSKIFRILYVNWIPIIGSILCFAYRVMDKYRSSKEKT